MQTALKTPTQSASFLDAARELGTAPQRLRRLRTRSLSLLVACCTGLGAWIVYLAISMPTGYQARAWSAAWVGFDILLLLALTGTVVAAMLRRQIVIMLAVFTATLLLCDAWFDIVLDWGTSDVWGSLASAAFIEVPLALFLLFRARKLVRVALLRRWHELGLPGDPPALYQIPLFFSGESSDKGETSGVTSEPSAPTPDAALCG
jgi:hypothetical protein